MKHSREVRVYYHDTDSYGVVWHGSSLKWFEEGRVELCEMLGLKLDRMQKDGITLPVVDLHVRYKASAFMNDRLIVETEISQVKAASVTFTQKVFTKETGKLNIIAEITIVAVDENGKLIKRLPDYMTEAFMRAMSQPSPVGV